MPGLLPQVYTIVSNAVSLHPVVTPLARAKLRYVVPITARLTGYLDPRWGRDGAVGAAQGAQRFRVAEHRECDNGVCKFASFTYGAGKPTLWRLENLNAATHDWLSDEFAEVPLTFFAQMARCVQAGRLLSVEGRPELPADLTAGRLRPTRVSRCWRATATSASYPSASDGRSTGWSATRPGATRCPAKATSTSSGARTRASRSFRRSSTSLRGNAMVGGCAAARFARAVLAR